MTRLSRKESQRETRQKIVQAAEFALARKGVAGAGINEIAQRAGYSRGAFYSNFESREDLLVDLLESRWREEIRFWNQLFESAGDLTECLTRAATEAQALAQTRTLIHRELQLEAERNERFRPHFVRFLDSIYAEIRRLFVTILQRHGKAPPRDLDAKIVGAYALGLELGCKTALGSDIGSRTTPSALMIAYVQDMIERAPPLAES